MKGHKKRVTKTKRKPAVAARSTSGSATKVMKLTRGQKIVEKMRGKATVKMSAEQILAITRGRV